MISDNKLLPWTRLPNGWIEDKRLREFRWAGGNGSRYQAGLMMLTIISNHAALETGVARLTYDELCQKADLSRAKVAEGLDVLDEFKLIEREPVGRSTFKLSDYDPKKGWAKFPAKGLYSGGRVAAFRDLHLRRRAELDALKLYFLFASRRDDTKNMALIGYDKIHEYSGVTREHIRAALSVLAASSLVHIDRVGRQGEEEGFCNGYRLAHLNPRQNIATKGRGVDPAEFQMT